jgi:hypothetical protein
MTARFSRVSTTLTHLRSVLSPYRDIDLKGRTEVLDVFFWDPEDLASRERSEYADTVPGRDGGSRYLEAGRLCPLPDPTTWQGVLMTAEGFVLRRAASVVWRHETRSISTRATPDNPWNESLVCVYTGPGEDLLTIPSKSGVISASGEWSGAQNVLIVRDPEGVAPGGPTHGSWRKVIITRTARAQDATAAATRVELADT